MFELRLVQRTAEGRPCSPGCMAMKVKPSPFNSFASCTVTVGSTGLHE